VTQAAQPRPRRIERSSLSPRDSGYPCAEGYAWLYSDGKLESCAVSREFALGEAMLPSGSILHLLLDGRPKFAVLQHNSVVAGVKCSGGNWLWAVGGAMTVFYPSGKLEQCWLAGDQSVRGCRA